MFLGETNTADYYGPPRGGQSFAQYESFMKLPFYTASAVIVGALIAGPVGAIAGGVTGYLFSGGQHSNKPTQQGG